MVEERTNKEKIEFLKDIISYNIYSQILECKLSKKELCDIYYEINESESWGDCFEIVESPKGKFQDCNDGLKTWVDQRRNVYSKDIYCGEVYVEIAKNKYLTWYFEM